MRGILRFYFIYFFRSRKLTDLCSDLRIFFYIFFFILCKVNLMFALHTNITLKFKRKLQHLANVLILLQAIHLCICQLHIEPFYKRPNKLANIIIKKNGNSLIHLKLLVLSIKAVQIQNNSLMSARTRKAQTPNNVLTGS